MYSPPSIHSLYFLQIEVGSTNVRVGSTIFGERNYPNKAATSKTNIENATENKQSVVSQATSPEEGSGDAQASNETSKPSENEGSVTKKMNDISIKES